jgi:hypothetical protein
VFPIGDTFVEVVSPTEVGTTAGRFLERNGGDCGYMAIFQVADIAACRDHLRAVGVRTIWSHDAAEIASVHIHPQDIGGAIVSFEEPRPPASWVWGGRGWESRSDTSIVQGLAGITLASNNPMALQETWTRILNLNSQVIGPTIYLPDRTEISFVMDQLAQPRLVEIGLKSTENTSACIAGTRFSAVRA